jgi:hypothetical protein
MTFDFVVREGMTAGMLLQKLKLQDYSLFRVSGKTGLMFQSGNDVFPLINDNGEIIAVNLGWGLELEDS